MKQNIEFRYRNVENTLIKNGYIPVKDVSRVMLVWIRGELKNPYLNDEEKQFLEDSRKRIRKDITDLKEKLVNKKLKSESNSDYSELAACIMGDKEKPADDRSLKGWSDIILGTDAQDSDNG